MSVIGPRPQLVRDMVFMTPEQRRRHTAKPGLRCNRSCAVVDRKEYQKSTQVAWHNPGGTWKSSWHRRGKCRDKNCTV